ncbi:vomeronasal type-1 receptor 4-like [Notamacropus eugenii]|uniref:vomeronasal type-1 receptor 4-like n=1 Tax=Notamacropus eugenii TaxID=9315 RepID=UPI003B678960
MIPVDVLLGTVLFFQTGIGVQGNFFLIYLFSFLFFTGQRMRPIDLILTQLAVANSLLLLSRGVMEGLAVLGLKNVLDDIGCKIVFYLHRVGRGLSLSTTCLLSGFQAIIISSHNPRWIKFKAIVPRYIMPSILFCWIFHMLKNIIILIKLRGPKGTGNISETKDYVYCSVNVTDVISASLHGLVISLPDAVCMAFLSFNTGYKICLLYKHHKRVQGVRTDTSLHRAFPETRATQMILLLVSIFLTFYLLNSILTGCMNSMTVSRWMIHSSAFLAACFPMVSPFVLIKSDPQIMRYYNTVQRRKKSKY